MQNHIPVSVVAMILFLAMVIQLASKPKFSKTLNGIFIFIAGLGALLIYGYGYAGSEALFPLAVVRTLLAVCGIYVGKVDFSVVSGTSFFQNDWAKLLFWVIHLMALYATASAAITTVGAEALEKIRIWLARWGELNLIYGVNNDSVELGKSILESRKCAVVFIDDKATATHSAAIAKARCVLRSDSSAVSADKRFLRSVGIRKGRRVTLYALHKDTMENVRFAGNLLESLKDAGLPPQQTGLVIHAKEDSSASGLQVLGEKYGYGHVNIYQEASLAARLLTMHYPPYKHISFDADGRATEDLEILQVGFGQLGQAVLRQLVTHGQFEGSTFRASVFAPDCDAQSGYFANNYKQVLERYDIRFYNCDARSRQMYDHILQRRDKIKYVVLCTGSEKLNRELAEDLQEFFQHQEMDVPVYLCSYSGIIAMRSNEVKRHKLYQEQVLSTAELDKMAMMLNHYYCNDESKTPLQHWMECNYFNRMSSRASADFADAMLWIMGSTREQAAREGWELTEKQLENLSRTEHLRWCAFHYCMGFAPMSEGEFARRGELYLKQLEETGKASIRIAKDMDRRVHACLVSWEELDDLSARENRITGKSVNYQALDTENVLAVPELMKLTLEANT